MKDLKFPVFKEPLLGPRHMSMDQYLQFILMCLKDVVDIKAIRAEARKNIITVPFVLRDETTPTDS